MGIVFEAEDTLLGRRVALKTLRSDNAELSYHLKREFRSLVGVSHHNLVQLYELGSDEAGYFFTMELVEGVDFLTYCRPDRLSEERGACGARDARPSRYDAERLRRALAGLSRGLGALHAFGLVHRDIKPSNVLVARNGRVVLIDFGLITERGEEESCVRTSMPAGTTAYAAPEQIGSDPAQPSADYYAVGVMLFEALAGRRPFEGRLLDVLQQKATTDAPDIRGLVSGVPEDLADLCMRLLARDCSLRAGGRDIAEVAGEAVEVEPARVPPCRAWSPLFGRTPELSVLETALSEVEAGACRTVLVRGQSGIGKTALLRAFLDHVAGIVPRAMVFSSRCYEAESIPYKAVDGLMDQLSEFWRRLPLAEAMYLLPREPEFLVRAFPVLLRVPAVADTLVERAELRPEETLRRSFRACRDTFQRLGRRGPLVLALDDVQWADADSLQLLCHLLEPLEAPAVLVVLTARADPTGSKAFDSIIKDARCLELGPIGPASMRDLLGSILGDSQEPILRQLEREAGGIPFLGATLARYAQQRPERATLELKSVLAEQLGGLPSEARRALELLAMAGSPLSPELLARAHGSDCATIALVLRELSSGNLVRIAPSSQGRRIEPYHDKIRESVLDAVAAQQRAVLHQDIGLALEMEADVDSGACARHFLGAGDRARACLHARRAGKQAEQQLAFARAAEHYRLCIDLGELGAEDRRAVRRDLANALSNAGRGPGAAEEYLVLASQSSADDKLNCEQRAAEEYLRAGYVEAGLGTLRAVLRQVGLGYPKGPTWALCGGLMERARARALLGSHRQPQARGALDLRRIDVCRLVANCVSFLDPEITFYYQASHLRRALASGDAPRLCRALVMEATYRALGGEVNDATRGLLARAEALANRTADTQSLAIVRLHEGMIVYYQGKWQEALDHCSEAMEALQRAQTGAHWELDNALLYILLSLSTRGDLSDLRRRLQRELPQAEARGDLFALTILRAGALHLIRLADDEPALIEADLSAVMAVWPSRQLSVPRFWELLALTNRDLYCGRFEQAFERFESWQGLLPRSLAMRVQVTRVKLLHARGRAALALAARGEPQLLAKVEAEVVALESEGVSWAKALALSLRAGVEFTRGDTPGCLTTLRAAQQELGRANLWLDFWCSCRWRARLEGGSEGQELLTHSTDWFGRHGVRNPDALARVYAPASS